MTAYPSGKIEILEAPADAASIPATLNRIAGNARGTILVMLNRDVLPKQREWLKHLITYALQKGMGCAGGMISDAKNRPVHTGLSLWRGLPPGDLPGLCAPNRVDPSPVRWNMVRNVTAVSGYCLATPAAVFGELKGFREELEEAYFDVDLCLRIWKKELRVAYVPQSRVFLHRSITARQTKKSQSDAARMRAVHGDALQQDRFFNPLYLG